MTSSTAPTTVRPPGGRARAVPTRRISFDVLLEDLPRHFAADGDLFHSHLASSLSALFPDGEDFFVRSVRHFRDEITDPEMKRQVGGFIGQESVHGREHRVLNDRLAELGYPTKPVERLLRTFLGLRSRIGPAKVNLAVTAALEHYTATLAEHLLTNEETRAKFGHDGVRDVFLWHALEESEHKAVAFDVYRAVGGSEGLRRVTMNMITVGFIGVMAVQMAASMALDRKAYNPIRFVRSARAFARSPLFHSGLWRRLRDYNRPGFHPDDHDATELVEQWRVELFGDEGRLNDRLAGAAA